MNIYLQLVLLLILLFFLLTTLRAFTSAAPWLPSEEKEIVKAIKELKPSEDGVIMDLGSGDGRLLTAVAPLVPRGRVIGIELSSFLYVWSRIKILFSNYPHIKVKMADLFKADLSQPDIVICFLMPKSLKRLETRFEQDLKKGAIVVSYTFKLPNRKPIKSFKFAEKSPNIYIYQY